MVFRSARVVRTGRRKLTAWSEYWLRVLPAARNLVRHGKRPGQFVWTDLEFTKRLYKQRGKADAKFTEQSLKLTPVRSVYNNQRWDLCPPGMLCTCTFTR